MAIKTPPDNLQSFLKHGLFSELKNVELIQEIKTKFKTIVDTLKKIETYFLLNNFKVIETVELDVIKSQHIEQPLLDFLSSDLFLT